MFAPLQGYTEAEYRLTHARVYGPAGRADAYFTPFIRLEKGNLRSKDRRQLERIAGREDQVVQVIFNGADELSTLLRLIGDLQFRRIDLNSGCPFSPQVRHGRGAGILTEAGCADVAPVIRQFHERGFRFSVKMRLGTDSPDDWRGCIETLNSMPLEYVTMHPRTARQQYSGRLDFGQFEDFMRMCSHPVVFNGEIHTRHDIINIVERYPTLHGVMIGRGALARPSIFTEYRNGEDMPPDIRQRNIGNLYRGVADYLGAQLCGEVQLLTKLKPFWEYLEDELTHPVAKAIRKAGKLSRYEAALPPWTR